MFESELQLGVVGCKIYVLQGCMFGGGSLVNVMLYVCGMCDDYDDWVVFGCIGWGWDDVLLVFKCVELYLWLFELFYGIDGLLKVGDMCFWYLLSFVFVKVVQEVGIVYNDDFNGVVQYGVGFYYMMIFDGQCGSIVVIYLVDVIVDLNLCVLIGCCVMCIWFDGCCVSGVEWCIVSGVMGVVVVCVDVVFVVGVLSMLKLLMLLGIGFGVYLYVYGIDVLYDSCDVGVYYQDYFEVLIYGCIQVLVSLFGEDCGWWVLWYGL